MTRKKLWTNSIIKLFESSSGCFLFFFLTQLVRHLFFARYFEDFTISKAVFNTKGSPVFFNYLVGTSLSCFAHSAVLVRIKCVSFSTCIKLPVVNVVLTKAQFEDNIA